MEIKLAGYDTVFPNEVYSRKEMIQGRSGGDSEIHKAIILRRHTVPTQVEILEYIRKKAAEASATPLIQGLDGSLLTAGKSQLEQIMMALSSAYPQITAAIAAGREEYMKALAGFSTAPEILEGEQPPQYLAVFYGIISKKQLEAREMPDAAAYLKALSDPAIARRGQGRLFELSVQLKEGALPEWAVIEVLAEHGYLGPVLRARGIYIPAEAKNVLRAVYSGLPAKQHTGQLKDISEQVREVQAQQTAGAFLASVAHLVVQAEPQPASKIIL